MNERSGLRSDADAIVAGALRDVLPDAAVEKALTGHSFAKGKVILVAVGKAAWQMAKKADELLGDRVHGGVVITKYEHVLAPIRGLDCHEAGHPIPDENSFAATEHALRLTEHLSADDTVVFLLSGGGSALFERPLIPAQELAEITKALLASGADIVEINTIRKRMSAVKGGRFGAHCAPAHVLSIVLSDIIGDPLDMIASGPAYPDRGSAAEAKAIAEKYRLKLSPQATALLDVPLPQELPHVETHITGSVRELCTAAAEECRALGYTPHILTDRLSCEARDAGRFLSAIAKTHANDGPVAYIAGGETVVHLTGHGKGGRNQEIALAAAEGLSGMENAAVFSFGSDGTDGPTDAAGGYADGHTMGQLAARGIRIDKVLRENDAYHALKSVDGLIVTGPTGTNVNDAAILLIR
ncbi:glycerate kinase [Selenomonas sp. F0473]|uniref:glycerate kinase type-2 family protein n=1 Tax=Selenomonas sp. F0473 TaxID=999423 RepID=UPI00029E51A0|nr:DUF4147 domain-containing protein [Selenomonas sp. F0473]EKU71412.1 hypothetical protein HMPREF9161_00097 [Selenomonas sp. F0473]